MRKKVCACLFLACLLALSACAGQKDAGEETFPETTAAATESSSEEESSAAETESSSEEMTSTDADHENQNGEEKEMQLKIGDTAVAVEWEKNESVEALRALCEKAPLTIQMSMYGGFEQVGPIGTRLPSDDVQTRTGAGDIVLYASSQIVVFYGSNSWAYTRLGHITDQDADGMKNLLGGGDVTITFSLKDAE